MAKKQPKIRKCKTRGCRSYLEVPNKRCDFCIEKKYGLLDKVHIDTCDHWGYTRYIDIEDVVIIIRKITKE